MSNLLPPSPTWRGQRGSTCGAELRKLQGAGARRPQAENVNIFRKIRISVAFEGLQKSERIGAGARKYRDVICNGSVRVDVTKKTVQLT